jgi:DNA topoisomerase-1
MTVRMGRFGPFVQIGRREDEEKPRFAGLRPGQNIDTITREEALELFKLPRVLGETPEGEEVSTNIGRYGPYVRYGRKFVSLGDDDPFTVTLDRALELIEEKKKADANRLIREFEEEGIRILNGRYGPYITDGKKNARIPKDREPASLTLEECKEALAKAPARGSRRKKAGSKKTASKKSAGRKKTAAKRKAPAD